MIGSGKIEQVAPLLARENRSDADKYCVVHNYHPADHFLISEPMSSARQARIEGLNDTQALIWPRAAMSNPVQIFASPPGGGGALQNPASFRRNILEWCIISIGTQPPKGVCVVNSPLTIHCAI